MSAAGCPATLLLRDRVPRSNRPSPEKIERSGPCLMTSTMVNRLFLALVGGLLVSGCAASQSRLMHPSGPLDSTAPADAALVVFVRGSTPRDDGWPFRIVDDKARFLGECVPSSKFAVPMLPGEHALFAWEPGGDLHARYIQLGSEYNQVGALKAIFEAGKTYTVAVSYWGIDARSMTKNPFVTLRFVDPSSDPEAADALRSARPFVPDAVAGQAAVDRDCTLEQHLALGMSKLGK